MIRLRFGLRRIASVSAQSSVNFTTSKAVALSTPLKLVHRSCFSIYPMEVEGGQTGLEDLPDDVLLRCLAGCGARTLCASAATCQRFKLLLENLATHTVFSSALATSDTLQAAVKDAADRALQGMLGTLDFAILFVCKRNSRGSPVNSAAEVLASFLPAGTPVLGCAVSGLFGIGPNREALEVDPSDRQPGISVAVLLARLPTCHIRVFCDQPPTTNMTGTVEQAGSHAAEQPTKTSAPKLATKKTDGLTACKNVQEWMCMNGTQAAANAAHGALQPQAVWLFVSDKKPGIEAAKCVMKTLQEDAAVAPVVVGGLSSGSSDLFFVPGRLASDSCQQSAREKKPNMVGLAICTPLCAGGCEGGSSSSSNDDSTSSSTLTVPVRAGAMAMRGCGPLPGSKVYAGVVFDKEVIADEDGYFVLEVLGCQASEASGVDSMVQEYVERQRDWTGQVQLGLWRSSPGEPLGSGLPLKALQQGQGVVLDVDLGYLLYEHRLILIVEQEDAALVDALLDAKALGTLCCQYASISPQGCQEHLHAELPTMRQLCSAYPLLPNGRPDPRSWEGYSVVRHAANAAGARAGPVAVAVFSCSARGKTIFGDSGCGEAKILDEVLHKEVPFVGAFCNGEIGPWVRSGYVGWKLSPMAVAAASSSMTEGSNPTLSYDGRVLDLSPAGVLESFGGRPPSSLNMASSVQVDTSASEFHNKQAACVSAVVGGRTLYMEKSQLQGFTSMYAALG